MQNMDSRACRLQQLWHVGSAVTGPRLSCSVACGIFPDQGSNPCFLHWQVDSSPLSSQESSALKYKMSFRDSDIAEHV